MLDEFLDAANQLADTAEAAPADGLLRNQSEPAFDLIERGGISWRVMNVIARPLGQPQAHLAVLVSGVVIDNQVYIELGRDGSIDALQECQEFLMAVTRLAFGKDRTGGNIEGSEECRSAVAHVVVRNPLDVA